MTKLLKLYLVLFLGLISLSLLAVLSYGYLPVNHNTLDWVLTFYSPVHLMLFMSLMNKRV